MSFALPADALPPLAYVEPEKLSRAPAAGWDMAGYKLVPLSPTASEVAAEQAKMGELGPKEPIVRSFLTLDAPCGLPRVGSNPRMAAVAAWASLPLTCV